MQNFTTREYSRHTGLSAVALRKLFKRGVLPAIRVGDGQRFKLLWPVALCDAALAQRAQAEAAERAKGAAE